MVKKTIDYFYLLDYKSVKDRDLNCASPADTDLAIDEITNLGTRNKIMGLQQEVPRFAVRECFQALTENGFDYRAASFSLCMPDIYRESVTHDLESVDVS